jgi:exopolyphosphatase/guanosine-5'-triphosphate,3'-diphosphate pyrophosphatase
VTWDEMKKKWIKMDEYEEVILIGSGGNINKLFKMSVSSRKTLVLHLHEFPICVLKFL